MRVRVKEIEIKKARDADPTPMLEKEGYQVYAEGQRHFSVRIGREEFYRLTRTPHGFICCRGNGARVGSSDAIALTQDVLGCSFKEAIERLKSEPKTQYQVDQERNIRLPRETHKKEGWNYLLSRGFSPEALRWARFTRFLRYVHGAVFYLAWDESGDVLRGVSRRGYLPLDPRGLPPQYDLAGTNKSYPAILHGSKDCVVITEGGADALALHTIMRPAPTVLSIGGVRNRAWVKRPHVNALLGCAKKIHLARDRDGKESTADLDAKELLGILPNRTTEIWAPDGAKDFAQYTEMQIKTKT